MNDTHNMRGIRRQFLISVSAIALLSKTYAVGEVRAADTDADRPQFWIELGGQYDQVDMGQQEYVPPFNSRLPTNLPSLAPAQESPRSGYDWNGKLSFEPKDSDWVFSAAIRYGRSLAAVGNVHKSSAPATYVFRTGFYYKTFVFAAHGADFARSEAVTRTSHLLLDFTAGRDVGLGAAGGTSVLSGGIRMAQFYSRMNASFAAEPDYHFISSGYRGPFDIYKGAVQAKRSFHGIGPTISWDASAPLLGSLQAGELDFDWGANGAVLFGRRTADISHHMSQCHYPTRGIRCATAYHNGIVVYDNATAFGRSHMAAVPNLGGFAGISMRYSNAKLSLGYRADFFFGAMDGGFDTRKSENIGFYGPFATVSVGFGG